MLAVKFRIGLKKKERMARNNLMCNKNKNK